MKIPIVWRNSEGRVYRRGVVTAEVRPDRRYHRRPRPSVRWRFGLMLYDLSCVYERVCHALYTLKRRLQGKPDYGFGSVPPGTIYAVCSPSCGPMWTPGYCDDDCPNAPQKPASWAAERAQVLAPSDDK